jgi:hypothetical protein
MTADDDDLAEVMAAALASSERLVPGYTLAADECAVPAEEVVRVVALLVSDLYALAEHDPVALATLGPAVEDVVRLSDSLVYAGLAPHHAMSQLAFVVDTLARGRS